LLEQIPETVSPVATLLTIALILAREMLASKRSSPNEQVVIECLKRIEEAHQDDHSKFSTVHTAKASDIERLERLIESNDTAEKVLHNNLDKKITDILVKIGQRP